MKTLAMIAISTLFTGCALFKPGPSVPPPLDGKWKVTQDKNCVLGFGKGTAIETRAEIFGPNQFDLRVKPAPCPRALTASEGPIDAQTLDKPTLFLTQLHTHQSATDAAHCPENVIDSADENRLLNGAPGVAFLGVFNDLAGKKIHTFTSGIGYLRDRKSTEDEPHLLISFSYLVGNSCDKKKRRYVLAVTSFGGQRGPAMHNGVVHGDP